jgi:hypothetical protein
LRASGPAPGAPTIGLARRLIAIPRRACSRHCRRMRARSGCSGTSSREYSVFTSSTRDWTAARCRKTFEGRLKKVPVHFGSLTDRRANQFKSSVGKISTRDLVGWHQEVGTCAAMDGEKTLYSAVSRQLNEVLNERFLAYVLDAKHGLAFSAWEEKKRREA